MKQMEADLLGLDGRFGWCPSMRVGRLQESYEGAMAAGAGTKRRRQCDWEDKDFVIASTRTLAQCSFPQHILDSFGTLICDESELIGSAGGRRVLQLFKCKYRIGGSATDRTDGTQHAVNFMLGAKVHAFQRYAHVTGVRGAVRVVQIDGSGAWRTPPRFVRGGVGAGEPDMDAYHADASVCAERNAFIIALLRDLVLVQRVRRVVVFTVTIAHVDELARLAKEALSGTDADPSSPTWRSALAATKADADSNAEASGAASATSAVACASLREHDADAMSAVVAHMHSQQTKTEARAAWAAATKPTCRVIVGTTRMLGRGYDDDQLGAAILALPPKGSLPQIFGRLQRTYEGKPTPELFDIVDDWAVVASKAAARSRVYNKYGFDVEHTSAREAQNRLKARLNDPRAQQSSLPLDLVAFDSAT